MTEENKNNRNSQEKRGVNILCDLQAQNCKDGLKCVDVLDNCNNNVGMCQSDEEGNTFLEIKPYLLISGMFLA